MSTRGFLTLLISGVIAISSIIHKDKVPIPSCENIMPHIKAASQKYSVDTNLILAIIAVESSFDPLAENSESGAKGLMQLIDGTAMDMGVNDVFDPRQNIMGGTRYLRKMIDKFGDKKLALAGYNAGPSAVVRYNGIPPYSETRQYVDRVLDLYHSIQAKSNE